MSIRTARLALKYGMGRAVMAYHALRGDPAAALLGVTQPKDPFPYYERIRRHGEIFQSRLGLFCTVSHPVCRSVLTDGRFHMPRPVGRPDWDSAPGDRALVHPVEHSLLIENPPVHTRLRKLITPWFTARALRDRTPRVTAIVRDVLDKVGRRDEFDVATEVAALVPLEVICDLLGIPIEDQERFVWWGTRLAGTIDGPRSLTERAEVRTTLVEMTCFFTDLIARYRRDPADNLISALACTTTDEFGERDLIALVELLFVAGLETTANLIGDIVRLLLEYPSQKALLLDDPGLAGNVVEEVLRFDPPTKFTARMAAEQVEVAGQMIPQGGFLFELLAGANRDPRVFTDPHRFDITRSNSRENISFSAGVHHCIGSGLARLEAEITVREIFERFPDMRMTGPARIRLARSVRGPYALAVEV